MKLQSQSPLALISSYDSIIFDCDGVLLDSNCIKSRCFSLAIDCYGADAMALFEKFCASNASLSRFSKFSFFLDTLLPSLNISNYSDTLDSLCFRYSYILRDMIAKVNSTRSLPFLRNKIDSLWLVVSAAEQSDLIFTLKQHNILGHFGSHVYGSPRSKQEIIHSLLNDKLIAKNTLFIGDSRSDYDVASLFDFDFLFVSGWSIESNPASLSKLSIAEIDFLDSFML